MSDSEEVTLLQPEALMAAACAQTGLTDFRDENFREPLAQFLASARAEARMSDIGVATLAQDVIRLLANRLLLQADFTARPEIAAEDAADPIVIVGNPRTGTTKLQRMLGAHPHIQSVKLWQILFPGRLPGDPDPRLGLATAFQQQLTDAFPAFMAAHPMVADEPEEEALLLQMTFDRVGAHNWFYRTPTYHSWLKDRDQHAAYAYLREVLQHLQWQGGGRRGPWVLKSPLHTGNITTFLETFPRATLVHCHRDHVKTVPSFCGLVELIRMSRGQEVDRDELGAFLRDELAEHWRQNLAARAALPAEQILDVGFDEIVTDPIAVIHKVFAAREDRLDEADAETMLRWNLDNPAGKYGVHHYSLEQYGLSADSVHDAFADYYAHFGRLLPSVALR
ncbi:putative sulfotransferase [Mycobacterium kiyosense]|uniref:sulfotransferase family protein n=1 Tax=Mycobacterium kiyosense TaxID=2871094 RepID=UPI00216F7DC7|nr:sulfotransferase [Mycobacterium kiyosense]GLD04225.1 putative sulfotransferase [Mycobacterium kiyosense]GLD10293.1 putative sulfotransferase [Mycobacterium kiyosense]GLD16345.1 putative sulfotransferase [Mycobacterium kiyosense]GLD22520.1 putative sulfotransferase [Mycobacterium kiyosense]